MGWSELIFDTILWLSAYLLITHSTHIPTDHGLRSLTHSVPGAWLNYGRIHDSFMSEGHDETEDTALEHQIEHSLSTIPDAWVEVTYLCSNTQQPSTSEARAERKSGTVASSLPCSSAQSRRLGRKPLSIPTNTRFKIPAPTTRSHGSRLPTPTKAWPLLATSSQADEQRLSKDLDRSDVLVVKNNGTAKRSLSPLTAPLLPSTPIHRIIPLSASNSHTIKQTTSSSLLSKNTILHTKKSGTDVVRTSKYKRNTKYDRRRYFSEPLPFPLDGISSYLHMPESEVFKKKDKIPRDPTPSPPLTSAPGSRVNGFVSASTQSPFAEATLKYAGHVKEVENASTEDEKDFVTGGFKYPFAVSVCEEGEVHGAGGTRKLKQAWRNQPSRLSL